MTSARILLLRAYYGWRDEVQYGGPRALLALLAVWALSFVLSFWLVFSVGLRLPRHIVVHIGSQVLRDVTAAIALSFGIMSTIYLSPHIWVTSQVLRSTAAHLGITWPLVPRDNATIRLLDYCTNLLLHGDIEQA